MTKAGPPPKKDSMTVVLSPEDAAIKDWLDLELLSAKVDGRLPRSVDRSQLVLLLLRGRFKPTRPAPESDDPAHGSTIAPTAKTAPRKRK